MKAFVVFLFIFCYAECRKVVPIDKNANLAFINMEGGGGRPVQPATPTKHAAAALTPAPAPTPNKLSAPQPSTPKVTVTTKQTVTQAPVTPRPVSGPIPPKSVNPPVVSNPITTPGPGNVKQLITFYDSQGKGSVIRPYSYSQAVKQG